MSQLPTQFRDRMMGLIGRSYAHSRTVSFKESKEERAALDGAFIVQLMADAADLWKEIEQAANPNKVPAASEGRPPVLPMQGRPTR